MTDKTEYRIVFANNISLETANVLRMRIVGALSQPDFGALTIMFSSEGGSTDQSMALYNFIRQVPSSVHMHAMGHVGSASIPVFLAADKRTCAKDARFFMHEYDWGFGERQTLHRMQEAMDRLRSDIQIARDIIKTRAPTVPDDVLKAIGGEGPPVIIAPDSAKTLGIVQDVCDLDKSGRIAVWLSGTAP